MKKFIAVLLLISLISISALFSVLYFSFNFMPEENYLNNHYRLKIAGNIFFRNLFKLNRVGDARSDYSTDDNFSKMEIVYYTTPDIVVPRQIKDKITEKIKTVVDKPGGITVKEESTWGNDIGEVDDDDLTNLINNHPLKYGYTARLNVFFLNSYLPAPSYAGLVKDAYNIFIFSNSVTNISHFEKTGDSAYISTVLHEFAHLLGAGHVEKDGCILSEKVEDMKYGRPAKITSDFCPEDLAEIRKASM